MNSYDLFHCLWLFFIYAFMGWCVEIVFCGIKQGHFVNRGFLNGPVCPIYGIGATVVVVCLDGLRDNWFFLFLGAIVLTSVLEWITGFILEKIYHHRWWDYSDTPFNIGGYICLPFSIAWGALCLVLVYVLNPFILNIINIIPHFIAVIILLVFTAVFIADFIMTIISIRGLAVDFKHLDAIAENMHKISEQVGIHLYEDARDIVDKGQKFKNSEKGIELQNKIDEIQSKIKEAEGSGYIEDLKNKSDELKKKYHNRVLKRSVFTKRLINAFPNLQKKLDNAEGVKFIKKNKKKRF